MTLTAFFNLRLGIAQQKGYARAIAFQIDSQAPAFTHSLVGSVRSATVEAERGDSDSRPSGAEALGDAALSPDSMYRVKRRFVSGSGMAARVRRQRLARHRLMLMEES